MAGKLLVIALAVVALAFAGTPVATVSTSGPLTLNGTAVPNTGVSEWPVAAGDEIATATMPAVILFKDGTRIAIDKKTRAQLHQTGMAGINLLGGTASYRAVTLSSISMQALGKPVDLKSQMSGTISIQGASHVLVAAGKDDDFGLSKTMKPEKPPVRSGHKKPHENDRGGGRDR